MTEGPSDVAQMFADLRRYEHRRMRLLAAALAVAMVVALASLGASFLLVRDLRCDGTRAELAGFMHDAVLARTASGDLAVAASYRRREKAVRRTLHGC